MQQPEFLHINITFCLVIIEKILSATPKWNNYVLQCECSLPAFQRFTNLQLENVEPLRDLQEEPYAELKEPFNYPINH